jgi:tRNA threonylcarbamoyladenosine biosynthesis protein TsaB
VDDLILLGIDTSGKTASASLFDTEKQIFLAQSTLYTQKTHSQVIMPMCKDIISQTGLEMKDIDAFAVADGPGSYTGLRIGVAAVKAICFALDKPCCGVSTLEGLAYNNVQHSGIICSVMTARGELVYSCIYKSDGYRIEKISEEEIIDRSELVSRIETYGREEKILFCGDGAEKLLADFDISNGIISSPAMRIQNAVGVCLAAEKHDFIPPEILEVSYLQKVKAEKELEERTKK